MLQGSTYTLKILLVEFSDVHHRVPGYTFTDFNNLFFSLGEYVSPNKYSPDGKQVFGSMRDYYSMMSDGEFDLTGSIVNPDANGDGVPDWIVLPKTKAQYDAGGLGNWNLFLQDVIAAATSRGLDITTGPTTKLAVIYAGTTYRHGGLNPRGTSYGSYELYINGEKFAAGGPYQQERSDAYFSEIGINAHEFAHLLNIPDLYDNGHWDLMNGALNFGPDLRGACPGPLNPVVRMLRGWIGVQDITTDTRFQADYYLRDPEVFKIRNGADPSNYWLIETRSFNGTMTIGSTTAPDYNSYLDTWFSNGPTQGVLAWRVTSSTSWGAIIHADGKGWPSFPLISAGDVFPGSGNVRVLSPWSDSRSPAVAIWVPNTKPSNNVGIEVISEGSGYYLLDLYYQHPENASPSKPQNLVVGASKVQSNPPLYCPKLTWNANNESDMSTYKIYRTFGIGGTYSYLASVSHPTASYIDYSIYTGNYDTAFYKIKAVDVTALESVYSNSAWIQSNVAHKEFTEKSGGADRAVPSAFAIGLNYPNPFNPSTTLRYELPVASRVSLVVFDVLGRQVAELFNGYREAGYFSSTWDASSVGSGVYYARFTASDEGGKVKYSKVNKLLLMK